MLEINKKLTMKINLCRTDKEYQACFPIFKDLHDGLTKEDYLNTLSELLTQDYQVVYAIDKDEVKSVAGFRIGKSFAWGKYLYIDDMVTAKHTRSSGYGKQIFLWLQEYAISENCDSIHLDSQVTRHDAHKFYINLGLIQGGYHFHMFV